MESAVLDFFFLWLFVAVDFLLNQTKVVQAGSYTKFLLMLILIITVDNSDGKFLCFLVCTALFSFIEGPPFTLQRLCEVIWFYKLIFPSWYLLFYNWNLPNLQQKGLYYHLVSRIFCLSIITQFFISRKRARLNSFTHKMVLMFSKPIPSIFLHSDVLDGYQTQGN